MSGCSAVWSARGLGPRGRQFKSDHLDQRGRGVIGRRARLKILWFIRAGSSHAAHTKFEAIASISVLCVMNGATMALASRSMKAESQAGAM